MSDYADDFLNGQRDCKEGVAHEAGKSKAYNDGYSAQYEFDQVRNEMGISREY